MCELFAVASDEEVSFDTLLPWACDLERFGVAGFGWGVSWLEDGKVRSYRRPIALGEDETGRELLREVRSSRYLVHLRRPTLMLTISEADTQPFSAPDRNFAFCHNGTFLRHGEFRSRYVNELSGIADSEVGFRLFDELLRDGMSSADALREVHHRLGGEANLAYLNGTGELLIYPNVSFNPVWQFRVGEMSFASTSIQSDDAALFELVFKGATDQVRLRSEVAALTPVPVTQEI